MNVLLNRKPVFTEKQLERLSSIFDNAGQVVLGIAVLGPLFGPFDKINWIVIASAMVVMIGFWSISIWLMKKGI